MKSGFKNIDMFKRLPKDLTEGSYLGALISIACIMIMVSLWMFELSSFFDDKISSVMKIEQVDPSKKMQINLELEFPSCPWDVIQLSIFDDMGTHMHGDQKTLKKFRKGGWVKYSHKAYMTVCADIYT